MGMIQNFPDSPWGLAGMPVLAVHLGRPSAHELRGAAPGGSALSTGRSEEALMGGDQVP